MPLSCPQSKRKDRARSQSLKGEMMTTIRIPRVAVSRELATTLIKETSPNPRDEIVIDGRGLVVTNESFAYQLASDLKALELGKIQVWGGSPKWRHNLQNAAKKFHLVLEDRPLV